MQADRALGSPHWLSPWHRREHQLSSNRNTGALVFNHLSSEMAHATSTHSSLAKRSALASTYWQESLRNVESVWGTSFLPRLIYNTFRNQKEEEMTWNLLSGASLVSGTLTCIPILISCCSITNHHRPSTLKPHPFICSQFYRAEEWGGSIGSSAGGLPPS